MQLREITRSFGEHEVLKKISLDVPDGSFTSLLGPSGCGKSTTLRIMSGLDQPTYGKILLKGQDVAELTASQRNVAMVFQSYALYPHLTVAQNIELPLSMRHMTRFERLPYASVFSASSRRKRSEHEKRVSDVAELLGIGGLLDRKPSQLSGGQKQRVALGRALVRDPVMFLLDEPLSNLDAKLRVQMRGELTSLHQRTGKPFVYVTHDQAEAMSMSDLIVVMMDGIIAQMGTPRELYEVPVNQKVAGFVGTHPINLIEVPLIHGQIGVPFKRFRPTGGNLPSNAVVGIRPEHLHPDPGGDLEARLDRVEYLGAEVLLHLRVDEQTEIKAFAAGGYDAPEPGSLVRLAFSTDHVHMFDPQTGDRLATSLERCAA